LRHEVCSFMSRSMDACLPPDVSAREAPTLEQRRATFGKYEVISKLGAGGMADVFLAVTRDALQLDKLVVLKLVRSDCADTVAMLVDEARLSVRLKHPSIVHAYEAGAIDGRYFLALEFLEGQSLMRLADHPKAAEIAPELR